MPLINYRYQNLDDFQTKLFLENHIKCLQKIIEVKDKIISEKDFEKGVLKSEYDELLHNFKEATSENELAAKVISQRKELHFLQQKNRSLEVSYERLLSVKTTKNNQDA